MWPLLPLLIACPADPPAGDRRPPDTGTPPPSCPVATVEVSPGLLPTQRAFAVELDVPAPIALLCVDDADPAEAHLLESPAATSHELRLSGLAYDTAYTCEISPLCGEPEEVAFRTDPVTEGVPTLQVDVDPVLGMTGAYTLMPFMADTCNGPGVVVGIWDADGRPRWGWLLPPGLQLDVEALLDPDGRTIVWGGGGDPAGGARILDLWAGELYATSFPEDPDFSHDAKRLPDGRLLTLEWRDNSGAGEDWLGFAVRVHDPLTGRIDLDFSSQALVDAGVLRTAGGFLDQDPYHANAVELDGDELVVGMCFDRSILAVDPATAEVRWRFGAGQGWTVQDDDGVLLGEDALPQCTHGFEVAGTRLLLYDNGRDRGASQVVEWDLDVDALVATRRWAWTEPGWFSEIWGDVDALGNERVLVTQANRCTSPVPTQIVEVDRATGAVASRITFPARAGTYRSERYDGCELFANARFCPAVAERRAALDAFFTR